MSGEILDPFLKIPVTVQVVHPFQANKAYLCPGCSHTIEPGIGHIVAVPEEQPDLRRHWHRPCWDNRVNRRTKR